MIHIPQEELLRKIEQEHNQLFARQNETPLSEQEEVNSTSESRLEPEEVKEEVDCGSSTSKSQDTYKQQHQQSRLNQGSPTTSEGKNQDMSSILPTTYSSIRDRNNNIRGTNNNEGDDDEIQTVLITGEFESFLWSALVVCLPPNHLGLSKPCSILGSVCWFGTDELEKL